MLSLDFTDKNLGAAGMRVILLFLYVSTETTDWGHSDPWTRGERIKARPWFVNHLTGNKGFFEGHLKPKFLCRKSQWIYFKGKGSENKRLALIDNREIGHIDGKHPKKEKDNKELLIGTCQNGNSLNFSFLQRSFSFCPEPPCITPDSLSGLPDRNHQLLLEC